MEALRGIIRELIAALVPLIDAANDPDGFESLLKDLGWTPSSAINFPPEFSQAASALLQFYNPGEELSITEFVDAVKSFVDAIHEIQNLPDSAFPDGIDVPVFKLHIVRDLLDYTIVKHLLQNRHKIGGVLQLAGIIRETAMPASGQRTAYLKREVLWNRIGTLFHDPIQGFREAFMWDSATPKLIEVTGVIASLLESYNLQLFYFEPEGDLLTFINTDAITPLDNPLGFDIAFDMLRDAPDGVSAGVKIILMPPTTSRGEAIAFFPYVQLNGLNEISLDDTTRLTISGGPDFGKGVAIIIAPGQEPEAQTGFLGGGVANLTRAQIGIKVIPATDEPERRLIGTSDATRVTIKTAELALGVQLGESNKLDIFAVVELEDARIVIKPAEDETDSFLATFLGPEGLSAQLSLGLHLSSLTGFHLTGSGGLEASFPVHITLGPIDFQTLTIGLKTDEEKDGLDLDVGATLASKLGPLTAIIDGMGFKFKARFPDPPTGNLGPLDLDFSFKPPSGVGLSIDGGGFSGGGFLRYYEEDERYEGMLELEYEDKISLKAIGLITTKLPGGKPGFSLVIIITAEFTPIQLGLGFTLNGVGGMLGYNRTADVERLRSGVRDDSLSSVLFPQNIVENASRILSDINQLFPARDGRFIFGPMARIGWGSPTRITIDLGLMIEVPSPVRVLILGVIRAVLPDEKAKLLHLQVNFLGVIDFGAQKLSFDASLYDSTLLGFTLSGDMAVRMTWGDEPNFLLSVGGFHPQYEPPPLDLPTLRRLTLQLTKDNNPRLTLEMYFAVTSNSVQFGAKVELYAGNHFAVSGFLSFDVLFQFNPFYFIASIKAKVALLAGGSEIASVSLDFTLEGPTPWHVKGKARLKICWFLTITVPFDHTFGEERNTRLDDIAVIPLLKQELSRPESWEAQLLDGHHALVSTKKVDVPDGDVVASPFGLLTVQQKVVPLRMQIHQVGSQKPADGTQFVISKVLVEGSALTPSDVEDQFAPAQYFEMSDADKLSSKKAFEPYPSGVRLDDLSLLKLEYGVRRVVEYELSYIDEQRDQLPKPERVQPRPHSFQAWALRGAVAASPLSQARKAPSALAPGKVQLQRELFVVVQASDLTPVEEALPTTQAQAHQQLQQLLHVKPHLRDDLLVIPQFEVNIP